MSEEKKFPICSRCKKPIEDIAYVELSAAIILQKFFAQTPPIFKCPESAADYAKKIKLHDDCFMKTLTDHGFEIADMKKLAAEYAKKELEALVALDNKEEKEDIN